MLVELSVMEQRYHAAMEVVSAAPVIKRWQREEPMQLWQLDVTGSVFWPMARN
jgi:hypothetical protein